MGNSNSKDGDRIVRLPCARPSGSNISTTGTVDVGADLIDEDTFRELLLSAQRSRGYSARTLPTTIVVAARTELAKTRHYHASTVAAMSAWLTVEQPVENVGKAIEVVNHVVGYVEKLAMSYQRVAACLDNVGEHPTEVTAVCSDIVDLYRTAADVLGAKSTVQPQQLQDYLDFEAARMRNRSDRVQLALQLAVQSAG